MKNPIEQRTFFGHSMLSPTARVVRAMGLLSGLLLGLTFTLPGVAQERADEHMARAPSSQHLEPALRAYRNGFYGTALRRFERAAFWADKLAQYNVGVIHYLGNGVDADSARAWAWFELAAERDYPVMQIFAEQVWNELDDEQRDTARRILESELLPRYGDAVAVERTRRYMDRQFRSATGSRLGNAPSLLTVLEVKGPVIFNQFTNSLTAQSSRRFYGPDFYREELWDFDHILASEAWFFDEAQRGSILLRDLEVDDSDQP